MRKHILRLSRLISPLLIVKKMAMLICTLNWPTFALNCDPQEIILKLYTCWVALFLFWVNFGCKSGSNYGTNLHPVIRICFETLLYFQFGGMNTVPLQKKSDMCRNTFINGNYFLLDVNRGKYLCSQLNLSVMEDHYGDCSVCFYLSYFTLWFF